MTAEETTRVKTFGKIQLNKPLPDKLADLLELALDDLTEVEKDPGYRVRMNTWHEPDKHDGLFVCTVCLAGAVLARGGVSREIDAIPSQFEPDVEVKLAAINELRIGNVQSALAALKGGNFYLDHDTTLAVLKLSRPVPNYPHLAVSQQPWYDAMRQLVADLRAAGL